MSKKAARDRASETNRFVKVQCEKKKQKSTNETKSDRRFKPVRGREEEEDKKRWWLMYWTKTGPVSQLVPFYISFRCLLFLKISRYELETVRKNNVSQVAIAVLNTELKCR